MTIFVFSPVLQCSAMELTGPNVSEGEFTNKLVLDLNRNRKRDGSPSLAELIASLAPVDSPVRQASHDVIDASFNYMHQRRDELRRKKKNTEIVDLEQHMFQLHDVAVPVVPHCQQEAVAETKEVNLLDYEINKKKKHLDALTVKAQDQKEKLGTSGHYSKQNVDKRDDRSRQAQSQLRKAKGSMAKATQEKDAALARVAIHGEELAGQRLTVHDLEQQLEQTNMQVLKLVQAN